MSGEDGGFLARWSRRKLAVEQEAVRTVPASAPEPAADAGPAGPDEALSEEELALLPRVEDLTPESDITAFLRNGVPEVLKKAALRRMWALDPAIRDYVGDARDYAWDWNVPGGVPGCGPLLPGDDMTERIEKMFSGAASPQQEAREAASAKPEEPPSPEPAAEEAAGLETGGAGAPAPLQIAGTAAFSGPTAEAEPASAEPVEAERPSPARTLPRRHGAALPKFDLF